MFDLARIATISPYPTRSISAENPTGEVGAGARAEVGEDDHTTPAASELGRGWKVRPCLRIRPGETHTLAEIDGPGIIQHVWMTVDATRSRLFTLRVYYDDLEVPSIECPVCDFFANGIDGRAQVASLPIAVNPTGGMNSYWPMPFRRGVKITISNDWPTAHPGGNPDDPREEFFYQITWSQQPVGDDAGYLHGQWRRATTTRDDPQFTILDVAGGGPGQYVGTYLIWRQHSEGWWGEGEVKFFVDGDGALTPGPSPGGRGEFPTICGTGTEDYFGGAWGFAEPGPDGSPVAIPFTTAFLGYPQEIKGEAGIITHGLYRWHVPDPITFRESLRVTCQALGWWPTGKYQPLVDDIVSLGLWYQRHAAGCGTDLPQGTQRVLEPDQDSS